MKKRLRKKKHLGEFAQYGFAVSCEFPMHDDATEEARLDALIDLCEANHLGIGGATRGFFVTAHRPRRPWQTWGRWRDASCTEEHRELIRQQLVAFGDLTGIKIGPLVDVWHGEVEDALA